MSTGFHIENSDNVTFRNNTAIGFDQAFVLDGVTNSIFESNYASAPSRALQLIGDSFLDLVKAVEALGDRNIKRALDSVRINPQTAGASWQILAQQFGPKVGAFSFGLLSNILASGIYDIYIKPVLANFGIT